MSIFKVAQLTQTISDQNFLIIFIPQKPFKSPSYPIMTTQTHSLSTQIQQAQSGSIKNGPFSILSRKKITKRTSSYLSKTSFRSSSNEDNCSSSSYSSNKNEEIPQGKGSWTKNEELLMLSCFKEVGANWKEISLRLKTKLPFEIKSHLLRVLRRMVDDINNTLRQQRQSYINFKDIKTAVQATDDYRGESFLKEGSLSIRECISNLIYSYLADKQYSQETDLQKIRQILHMMSGARRKKHSSKASTQIYMREEIQYENFEQGYISDQSSFIESPAEHLEKPLPSKNMFGEFADEEQSMPDAGVYQSNGVIMQDTQQGISNLLRESGILQVECRQVCDGQVRINYQQSPVNSDQHLNNEDYQHFYEEGELEHDCYWKITPSRDSNDD